MAFEATGYRICRLARKIHQHLTKVFASYGVTPEQVAVLMTLWEEQGISQRALSDELEKDQNNVKAIIDRMCDKGIVRRSCSQEDRRAFCLYLTVEGEKLAQQIKSVDETVMAELVQGVKKDEIENLHNLCLRLEKNIK